MTGWASMKRKKERLAEEGKEPRSFGLVVTMRPSAEQQKLIHKTFGCARLAYNSFLQERKRYYESTGKTLPLGTFKKQFNEKKKTDAYHFLREPDKFAMESAMEHLDDAYTRFFHGQNDFPRFKSRRSARQSYSTKFTNNNIRIDAEGRRVKLPKLGWIPIRLSKGYRTMLLDDTFGGVIQGATVSYHSSGVYQVSLRMEIIIDTPPEKDFSAVNEDEVVGIDMGLTHLLIDSNGIRVDNPRWLQQKQARLKRLQRRLSRKKRGSANHEKLKKRLATLHLAIANARKDVLHKESRRLVDENQVIVLEDLHVQGMVQNQRLARSISDAGWSTFRTFVSYKAKRDEKKVVVVDRFFASSKVCHVCKEKNALLSLSDREWVCPSCSHVCDRDENAAANIKEEGIRLLQKDAA